MLYWLLYLLATTTAATTATTIAAATLAATTAVTTLATTILATAICIEHTGCYLNCYSYTGHNFQAATTIQAATTLALVRRQLPV